MTHSDDMNDWKYEVENGDTVLGFRDWLEHKQEADKFSPMKAPCYQHDSYHSECSSCREMNGMLNS